MNHLKGVFLVVAIFLVLALADGARRRQEFDSDRSSDAATASHARLSSSRARHLPLDAYGRLQRSSNRAADADEASASAILVQDSVSESEDSDSQDKLGASQETAAFASHRNSQAHLSVGSHQQRATAGQSLVLTASSSYTNETLATLICGSLDDTYTSLTVNNQRRTLFLLPSCLRNTKLTEFSARYMVVPSFDYLPPSIEILSLRSGVFKPNATDSGSTPAASTPAEESVVGYNSDGSLNWSELFAFFPNLTDANFNNAQLHATLPSVLPSGLTRFDMSSTALSGTIPSGLLSAVGAQVTATSSIQLALSNTLLTGSLPTGFFSSFAGRQINVISLSAIGTQLQGDLPADLFDPFQNANMDTFSFNLQSSKLSGSLPTRLIPTGMLGPSASYSLALSDNSITGRIADGSFDGISSGSRIYVYLQNNKITGPLPSYFFLSSDKPPLSVELVLNNNLIDGSLRSFFSPSWTSNKTVQYIILDFESNQLSGPIPEALLFNYAEQTEGVRKEGSDFEKSGASALSRSSNAVLPAGMAVTRLFELSLSHNSLTGTVPSKLLATSFSSSTDLATGGLTLGLSYNLLEGSVSSDLFHALPASVAGFSFSVGLASNSFTGTVPSFCRPSTPLTIDMSSNNFDGPIPSSWQSSCWLAQVVLNDNPNLSGSIPAALLNSTSITQFVARNTNLTGLLPGLGNALLSFDLTNTKLDFCDSASLDSISGYASNCLVGFTEACNCSESYTQCGSSIACPAEPTSTPIEPPTAPTSSPTSSPTSPTATPVATSPTPVPVLGPSNIPTGGSNKVEALFFLVLSLMLLALAATA